MKSFRDHIWLIDHPIRVAAMDFGTRATVVRLPSGGLVIINPVAFDDDQAAAIDALGPVDTIVSANLMHHLFFADACRRWPTARVLHPPGLDKKTELPDRAQPLGDRGDFEDHLHWVRLSGAPKMGEHLFICDDGNDSAGDKDDSDGVLIITDAAFHFVDHPQWWLRTFMRLNGAYGELAISRHARGMVKDATAFGAGLQAVDAFDFDAIVVTHGTPLPRQGKAQFRRAFARYLK